ncbi:MAG: hypothetical protein K0Q43_1315 [Ramlibacter sp.]|jgi:hypothetical protein|nr:hypothetical protein [Ramlibacter sp.]
MKSWMKLGWMLAAAGLGGCATAPIGNDGSAMANNPWAVQSSAARTASAPIAPPGWHHLPFPGKTETRFRYARKDGRDAIAVQASSSASMLRTKVRIEPVDLAGVRFSWKVPELIAGADLAARDTDDSPVRIVLFFEGDRSRFSPREAMTAELVRAVTGEEMPYATLMYVWCNRREPGTVINSPRTTRVRTMVVESGNRNLNQWLDYERDIRADYQRAFGEAPGALLGIGIMTDSDNTRSTAQAWYGPVRLHRAAAKN